MQIIAYVPTREAAQRLGDRAISPDQVTVDGQPLDTHPDWTTWCAGYHATMFILKDAFFVGHLRHMARAVARLKGWE